MAYTAQFRLVYGDVEKRWMGRFKSHQIKAFGKSSVEKQLPQR